MKAFIQPAFSLACIEKNGSQIFFWRARVKRIQRNWAVDFVSSAFVRHKAKLDFHFSYFQRRFVEITTKEEKRGAKWVRLGKQCDRVKISLFFSYTLYNFITLQLY